MRGDEEEVVECGGLTPGLEGKVGGRGVGPGEGGGRGGRC